MGFLQEPAAGQGTESDAAVKLGSLLLPVFDPDFGRGPVVVAPRQLVSIQSDEMGAARAEMRLVRIKWRADRDFASADAERGPGERECCDLHSLLVEL